MTIFTCFFDYIMKSCFSILSGTMALLIAVACSSKESDHASDDEPHSSDTTVVADSVHNYVKLKINPIGGSLGAVFNDINSVQLPAAEALGIKPISGPKQAWNINRPLVKIEGCEDFHVDKLTHSIPYLVPEAAGLLHEIGRRFNDSLESRGGGNYRLKVTSVLRTDGSVSKLRRRNINATSNSAHRYGTTFDISYINFQCDSITVERTQEDLKNLLAEILNDVRKDGRCYVKFERKQGCFHITARK